jgi:phosphatidylglycerophosphatase A
MKFESPQKIIVLILSTFFLFSSCDFKKSNPIALADKLQPGGQGLGVR